MVSGNDNGQPSRSIFVSSLQASFILAFNLRRHRKNGSRTPLPVSRIEFLRDFHDNVSHIVSSHANAKFFQKCKCSATELEARP